MMNYFHYQYKHDHLQFSSHIYKISTYHYNWHPETEVLVLLQGRVEVSCNTERTYLEPLDVIIIAPQVGHATLALEPDTTALVMHMDPKFFTSFDPDFGTYRFILQSDESTRHNEFYTAARQYMAQMMLEQLKADTPLRNMAMESYFLGLSQLVYNKILPVKAVIKGAKPAELQEATFENMIAYIDDNYQNKIELEDIAAIGGYNVSYASQFFKRQIGISFMEYLLRMRLREAAVLLANGEEQIVRIANQCGFPDSKAFNMAFKKHFQTTPSEYRKQAQLVGRKTKLHDWKEMISVTDTEVLSILQSFINTKQKRKVKSPDATVVHGDDPRIDMVREELKKLLDSLV